MPSELQRADRGSLYWSSGGVHWPAIVAQLVGMAAVDVGAVPDVLAFPSG